MKEIIEKYTDTICAQGKQGINNCRKYKVDIGKKIELDSLFYERKNLNQKLFMNGSIDAMTLLKMVKQL